MKLRYKAALFSAFLIPGAGYFVLNKKVLGFGTVILASVLLAILTIEATNRTKLLVGQILQGNVPPDVSSIYARFLALPTTFDPQLLYWTSLSLALVWIISIVDGFRIGFSIEKN